MMLSYLILLFAKYSGEFVIVYHAALTTKDGQQQEVAVKSVKSMSFIKHAP